MACEGGAHVDALLKDELLHGRFPVAAATLLSRFRWRQPYSAIYCPHDNDQSQCTNGDTDAD